MDYQELDDILKKAKGSDMTDLFSRVYGMYGVDDYDKRGLIRFADERGLTHHLPDAAHGVMHDMGIRHKHPGVTNEEQDEDETPNSGHEHTVVKAYNPISGFGTLAKSWTEAESDDVYYEGWLSTPARDLQKDIIEATAFTQKALDGYFSRSAPVSVAHNQKTLPAGHLQKAGVVVNGKLLYGAAHPTDPGEFQHLPAEGTGVWVRGHLTEEPAKSAVRKGNVGGMSFIANGPKFTRLAGGGMRVHEIDPLMETTVAPYPVNPEAVIAVAKAFQLEEQDMSTLGDAMKKALDDKKVATPAAPEITLEALAELFAEMQASFTKAIDEKIEKALPVRGEGTGRKGIMTAPTTSTVSERDANPAAYLIAKAQSGKELDLIDKQLAFGILREVITKGLTEDNGEGEIDWSHIDPSLLRD